MTPARVVSLIASSTEIVCALGLQDRLVGRSHECDYPPEVKNLPQCTETKFVPDGTSYEIDQKLKAILQEGLSVYRVFADRLRELKPDVILTQIQCEVCAVSAKDVEAAVCEWVSLGGDRPPRVVALNPNSLDDIWKDILKVAEGLGELGTGDRLIRQLRRRMLAISEKTRALSHRPTIACIEWIEPLMTAGNWSPELVEMAGGENLFGEAGRHSPYLDWAELVAKDPEFLIVFPCGWDIARTQQDMRFLVERSEWKSLKAVRTGHVYLADGNQFFNRPGPRIVESLEILAEILHPGIFSFGHRGSGWVPYSG